MNNKDKRTKQIRFEFRCITIPYTVFAIIVLLFNIFYTNIKVTMSLFDSFCIQFRYFIHSFY